MINYHYLSDQYDINESVLTLGNFDSVHLGHVNLINDVLSYSKEFNVPSVLLSFYPHSNKIIKPNNKHKDLLSIENKFNIIKQMGIDNIDIIKFDKITSNISADDFMNFLILKYNPKCIVIGYDNYFGRNREGSYDYLINNKKYKNIKIIKHNKYAHNGFNIKTSIIKNHIAKGEINIANNYLGYKYKISGKVVEGDKRGRELGFPTANINLLNPEQLIPLNGVYSVNLIFDRRKYKGICNIGYRPTLNNSKKITIETHIVNILDIKLYNEIVEIEFVDYLRKEIKFNNVEKLITQIKKDIKKITLMEK